MKKVFIPILILLAFVFEPSCTDPVHQCAIGEDDYVGAKCEDGYTTDHIFLPCLKHDGVSYMLCN